MVLILAQTTNNMSVAKGTKTYCEMMMLLIANSWFQLKKMSNCY